MIGDKSGHWIREPILGTNTVRATVAAPSISGKHLPALDGVRALAILAVLVFHFFQHRPPPGSAMEGLLRKLANLGSGGVDLFFVLSGFLITGILLDAKGRTHALRNFYMRRVLRIFPLYYGFLVVLYLLLPLARFTPAVPFADQWWFWTYCSNLQATFSRHFTDGPGHFWSLAIEEQFYLIWPFLALRYPLRKLCFLCGGLIAGAVVMRAILLTSGFDPYYFTLCRMDALACGALIAASIRLPGGAAWLRLWGPKILLWVAPAVAVLYAVMSGRSNAGVQIAKYTLIAALCACLMILAINARPNTPVSLVLGNKPLRSVGKYSYGMYVLHPSIIGVLQSKTLHLPIAFTLPLAVAATFCAAWIVWHIWEEPFLRLKRFFPSSGGTE